MGDKVALNHVLVLVEYRGKRLSPRVLGVFESFPDVDLKMRRADAHGEGTRYYVRLHQLDDRESFKKARRVFSLVYKEFTMDEVVEYQDVYAETVEVGGIYVIEMPVGNRN